MRERESTLSERSRSDADAVADAVLAASRVLVAVAARSIAQVGEDITLSQYRALVVLASRGPQRPSELAEALAMSSSAASRLCDRLNRKQFVERDRAPETDDRRAVSVRLTAPGVRLVDEVTRVRRAEIRRIVARIPSGRREGVVSAFMAFAEAAGEVPAEEWAERWTL